MEQNYLPKLATTAEACAWLQDMTGEPWTLARLIEHTLMPWFWLDYRADADAVFSGHKQGYLAPLCFAGDAGRLAAGGRDVLVTMTRNTAGALIAIPPGGLVLPVDDLRFRRDDITVLAGKFPAPADAPAAKGEDGAVTTRAPATTTNKLRRNNLDPAIDKAINQAEKMELADVYLELKALALAEEKPFTGELDGDALCYTDDNNKPAKLTKDALGKRLKNRRQPPLAAVSGR